MVGRDAFVDQAEHLLGSVLAGDGRFLLLAGEAGIGKTRLVDAIERQAAAMGFRHIRGQSFLEDREVPGAPFLDLAGAMSRDAGFAGTGADLAAHLRLIEADEDLTGPRRRRQLVLDVVDVLVSVAPPPTVIAIENLTDADELSLEILARLARQLPGRPLLVVGTYRSDELYPRVPLRDWRARLLTGRLVEEIQLGRLSRAETAQMTSVILDQAAAPSSDMLDAVYERTDGIPLHVEELLGVILEQHRADHDAVLAADVPDTLDEVARQRLDALSVDAQRLVRAASVIGHDFDLDLLAALVRSTVDEVWPAVAELLDRFILISAGAQDRYGFRHALIRDAIYQEVPVPDKVRLHRLVAELLDERGDASDAFLSHHYEQAGVREEAFHAAMRGARAAAAISSHRAAFALYQRARRQLPNDLPLPEQAAIHAALAAEAAASDDNAVSSEAYAAARERYVDAGAILEAASLISPMVAVRHLLGDSLDVRLEMLRQAIADVEELPSDVETTRVRGRLLASLANTHMYDLRVVEARRYAEEARALADGAADAATGLDARITIANALLFEGRVGEGTELGWSTIRDARSAQLEVEASRCYRMLGSSSSEVVEYERGERLFREGIEYAERVERWNDRHYMAAHLGLILWATGRWREGWDLAERALVDGRPGITTRITASYVLGYIAMGRGDWERARQLLQGSLELGEPMGEILRTSLARWGLAETALLTGDARAALELARRGRAASEAVGDAALLFPFLVTGTRAHLAVADPAGAERWVDELESELRRTAISGTLPAIDHARGLVLAAAGATTLAREALEVAVRGWDTAGRVWEGTWVKLDLASVLFRINRVAAAVALVEDVRSIGDRLGSRPLVERASELLRATRARRGAEEPWRPLTAREFEVAKLIVAGRTNAEIAVELDISPRTASSHVEHILTKLGVARRTEIAVWASAVLRQDGGP